jgi:mRNA interferase RelE/StbE
LTKPSSRQPTPEPKYTIQIDRDAEKMLRRQGRTTKERLIKAILVLADNPHPPSSRKLEGYVDLFRLRVGDWRVIKTSEIPLPSGMGRKGGWHSSASAFYSSLHLH